MAEEQSMSSVESDQRAALSAAIHVGLDDIEAASYEVVENPDVWVGEIAKTVTAQALE